jgi:hypothetical protein
MRLWSFHPKYLDTKGLVAVWREGLLAKKVLEGKTVGYRNHPQLIRFREYGHPIEALNIYLNEIHDEAIRRGFNFDKRKIKRQKKYENNVITVTRCQIKYEFELLKQKLKKRDEKQYFEIKDEVDIQINIVFKVVDGEIENWERIISEIIDVIKRKDCKCSQR